MKRLLFLTFSILCLTEMFSQSKIPNKLLTGIWVKTTNNKDTFKFSQLKDLESYCELVLEKGTKPPRRPEGLYEYTTWKQALLLYWAPSSNFYDTQKINYLIDTKNNTLMIDNFYNAENEAKDKMLIFKKIK